MGCTATAGSQAHSPGPDRAVAILRTKAPGNGEYPTESGTDNDGDEAIRSGNRDEAAVPNKSKVPTNQKPVPTNKRNAEVMGQR